MAWAMKYSNIQLEVKKITEVAEDAYSELLTCDAGTSSRPFWILSILAETFKENFLHFMVTISAAEDGIIIV